MKVIADLHEKNSLVASELVSLGVNADFQHLKVADYLIGNIAIERKTINDFISSMINRRLLRQLEDLQQYEKKLLIIEGIDEQELYNDKNDGENKGMHSNSIRGMLLYTSLEANCPIILTKDYQDTAKFLFLIARKMEKTKQPISLHAKKKARNKKEQIQYIIEGFPGIGPATARKLIKEFKTIKSIINADIEKLRTLIGKKADIFKIIE